MPRRFLFNAVLRPAAILFVLAGGVSLVLAGCRTTPEAPRVERGNLPAESFRVDWKLNVDTAAHGDVDELHYLGHTLVAYTGRNAIYAIESSGGRTRFVTTAVAGSNDRLGRPVIVDATGRAGTAIEDTLVFSLATGFDVFTLDGDRILTTRINAPLQSPPFVSQGLVYVGLGGQTRYGGLIATVDPFRTIAPVLERVLLAGAVLSRPVEYQGLIYAATDQGRVYAVTPTGAQAWGLSGGYFAAERGVVADLMADDYALYVASLDTKLYALDRNTGRVRWTYFAESPLRRAPIPTERHVFQPVTGMGVVCLPKTTGATVSRQPLWVAESARRFLSHDSQRVYLLHDSGHIVAHDKETGRELFRSRRSDFTIFATNTTGATIYAARADGEVVAIEPVLTFGSYGEFAEGPAGDKAAVFLSQ